MEISFPEGHLYDHKGIVAYITYHTYKAPIIQVHDHWKAWTWPDEVLVQHFFTGTIAGSTSVKLLCRNPALEKVLRDLLTAT